MRDILHFSHANGFPAGTYQHLFDLLEDDYDVRSIDRLGHHDDYPVTDNWPLLVQELTHYFERHYSQPVIAVGHSLGGVLSYVVSCQRPDLVKALIMLDSPVLTPVQRVGLTLLKRLNLADQVTPAARTEGRRDTWASQEEAIEYFSGKSLMKRFDPQCLRDYVSAGTELIEPERPEAGIRLRFDPDIEMQIYRAIPHKRLATGRVPVPAAILAGEKSRVVRPVNSRYMQNKLGMQAHLLPGGHMFPLEHPKTTTDTIKQLLQSWS